MTDTEPDIFTTSPGKDDDITLTVFGSSREISFAEYTRLSCFGLIQLCHECTDTYGHRVYHPAEHLDGMDAARSIETVLLARTH